jgi:hypothetical protein
MRKINGKFLITSLKTLTNYKFMFRKPGQNVCPAFLLCHWPIFVLASLLLIDFLQCMYHSRLPELFSESQAASCKHSQGQMAALGFLKRVTERIFKHGKVISKK